MPNRNSGSAKTVRTSRPSSSTCVADGRAYDAVLFWAYRYAEVYFGLPFVADRAILVPTAEEDSVIRLSILDRFFSRPAGYIFLTPEEQDARRAAHEHGHAAVVRDRVGAGPCAAGVRRSTSASLGVRTPFILYLGRIDPNKGCADLLHHFLRFKAEHGGPVQLVMAGPASMPLPGA